MKNLSGRQQHPPTIDPQLPTPKQMKNGSSQQQQQNSAFPEASLGQLAEIHANKLEMLVVTQPYAVALLCPTDGKECSGGEEPVEVNPDSRSPIPKPSSPILNLRSKVPNPQ